MFKLSREVKSAVKVSLSLVITYAIAFSQDWENPYWAAFAIIFTNLSTVGQSLGKAALRFAGTVSAVIFAFILLSLFPQQRWMFMTLMSLYLFVCAYLGTGKRIPYFFTISGVVCILVCFKGGVNTQNTFDVAILRIEQTGLGILVATVVNMLVWPEVSSDSLGRIAEELFQTFRSQYVEMSSIISGNSKKSEKHHLKARALLEEFAVELAASTIDTPQIFIDKDRWRYFNSSMSKLFDELEVLRESISELNIGEIRSVLVNIDEINELIIHRMEFLIKRCTVRIDAPDTAMPELIVNNQKLEELSLQERALIELVKKRIKKIERLCADLIECISHRKKTYYINPGKPRSRLPVFDRDRLILSLRTVLTLWITFLIWVNFRIPGGTGFVVMGTSFAMAFLATPKTPVSSLTKAAGVSILLASILYIFVLPHLTEFVSLGLVIFALSFFISYIFRKKEQTMNRTFGLAMTFAIVKLSTPQDHDIMQVLTMSLMFVIIVVMLFLVSSIPEPMYPGNMISGFIRRFWGNAEKIFAEMNSGRINGFYSTWGKKMYYQSISSIPDKLHEWIPFVNKARFPQISRDDLDEVNDAIRAIAIHIEKILILTELTGGRGLMASLEVEFGLYRKRIGEECEYYSQNKMICAENNYTRLVEYRSEQNKTISKLINKMLQENDYCEVELERTYRVIGHYNAVVSAILRYLKILNVVDIQVLNEFRL